MKIHRLVYFVDKEQAQQIREWVILKAWEIIK